MAVVDQLDVPGVPKVIGPARHAMLDYGVAASFIGMGFRLMHRHRRAAALAFINGGMVLAMSMMTDYPGGIWRRISFKMHGALDIGQAALAGFGPVVMGFAGEPEAKAFYSQAMSELGVIATTDWQAMERAA